MKFKRTLSLMVRTILMVLWIMAPGSMLLAGDCPSPMGYEGFGSLNQGVRDVAVLGSDAFTADLYGMTVYDVRNETQPVQKAELLLPETASAIALGDSIALVADCDVGLQIIDISNPSAPRLIGSVASGERITDVVVEGHFAYLIGGGSKLLVYDISNPAAPTEVGSLESFLRATALVIAGRTLYIADSRKGLEIVDISDPSSPILLSSFPKPIPEIGPKGFEYLAVSGDLVLALSLGDAQSYVIDVSDPAHPEEISRLETSYGGYSAQLSGSMAYLVDGQGDLNVFDLSDPVNPELLAVLEHAGGCGGMCLSGERIYLATPTVLRILDISNSSNPILLAAGSDGGFAVHLAVAGGVAYVADWEGGLQLIDTSLPSDPNLLGDYGRRQAVVDVASGEGVAYILVLGHGLEIIDVSNPGSPSLLGEFQASGNAFRKLVISGSRAYVLQDGAAVDIIDVSVPTAPVLLGRLDGNTMDYASTLAVSNQLMYLSGAPFGLRMIDVSNPSEPVVLGEQAMPPATDIEIAGDLAYLTNREDLEIVNISNPGNPYLLGSLGSTAEQLTVSGGLAFLANGSSLEIVDVSDPVKPEVFIDVLTRRRVSDVAIDPLTSTAWLAEGAIVEAVDLSCTSCAGLKLSAAPTVLGTEGQGSTIRVTVSDMAGRPVSDAMLEGESSLGLLSAFSDEGDGSYTASLEPGAVPGVASIHVGLDGMSCPAGLEVRIFSDLDASAGQGDDFIPVATRGAGAHDARWRTSLGILGRGDAADEIVLRYMGEDPPVEKRISILPGQQLVLPDVMEWMGVEGSGAIKVLSGAPMLLSSRSYAELNSGGSCPSGGTVGQFLAAEAQSPSLDAGEAAYLPQLVENENFRSNIALTNTQGTPASVRVRLYRGEGGEVASFLLKLWPGQWIQENRPFVKYGGISHLDAGWARVEVLSGSGIIGYASIIDNRSNDPMTMPLIPAGEGEATDAWIPVASNLPGAHQSQWRSELGVLNPGPNEAAVNILFEDGSASQLNQQLCPGCQLRMADFLGTMGVTGAAPVRIRSSEPVITSSRVYSIGNGDESCRPPGTMGQFMPASSTGTLLESGQVGFLPQLVENASFRTNIALMNTGDEWAQVRVLLFDADGEQLASFALSIGPGELRTRFRPFLSLAGREDLDACYARVEILSGAGVMGYASVVDNLTNDATTIPLLVDAGRK